MSLQNVNVMSKLEAHSLDFILSFLDKWTKDNMQQEAWYRGVYIPNENISMLQLRALEILRSWRVRVSPQQQQNYNAFFFKPCLSH